MAKVRRGAERPGPRQARIEHQPNRLKAFFFALLGPGLITGAADDDPSGIGTYSINGAALGYAQLWVGVVSVPMMVAVQTMVSRLGLVTGLGLAANLKRHYPRWVLYLMVLGLVVSNTITVGADIGAIGEAVHLLVPPIPSKLVLLPVAVGIALVLGTGGYALIRKIFKWLTLVLFAYIGSGVLAKPDLGEVLKGTLVPRLSFDSQYLSNLVALFGATVSPYLMFWQATEEVEEQVEMGRQSRAERVGTTRAELKYSLWDVSIGMLVSQVITYFIQISTAATLHQAGQTEIDTATQAAQALRPLAGDADGVLFAFGLIGAGCLAVPVLAASGAFALAEVFGWRAGLNHTFGRARGFHAAIAGSLLIGLGINFVGISPFKALFLASLIFGLLTPPLVLVVLLIVNNRRIMGDARPGRWLNGLGVLTLLTNAAAAVGLLLTGGK